MPDTTLNHLAGYFIVFDGPDGCGKTTQLNALITRLDAQNVKYRRLREPGGTPIGEKIRKILLDPDNDAMDLRCEMLLYMASRAQLVHEQIRPALANGECVLSDRFASSTLAYQGGGGGIDLAEIQAVTHAAIGNTLPHLTLIFDLDIDQAMTRLNPLLASANSKDAPLAAAGGLFHDRIEQRTRDYFQKVRQNYRWQAKTWPDRYRIIDAAKPIPHVEKQVLKTLTDFFKAP